MEYDVIISGAGPAGSTTARYAAKHGLKMLLIDKQKFPRHKACGGAVEPRVAERYGLGHLIESYSRSFEVRSTNGLVVANDKYFGKERRMYMFLMPNGYAWIFPKREEEKMSSLDLIKTGINLIGLGQENMWAVKLINGVITLDEFLSSNPDLKLCSAQYDTADNIIEKSISEMSKNNVDYTLIICSDKERFNSVKEQLKNDKTVNSKVLYLD